MLWQCEKPLIFRILLEILKEMKTINSTFNLMPALCLDFDGTVRRTKSGEPFISNVNEIELMPNIEKVIWIYRRMGFLIFGVSNQGGVAHGYKTPQDVELEMKKTLELFTNNPFHAVKFCFHEEDGDTYPYNHKSLLRKPNIGMLALLEYEAFQYGRIVDWSRSLFVGDREEDELCAKNAGVEFQHIGDFLKKPHQFEVLS